MKKNLVHEEKYKKLSYTYLPLSFLQEGNYLQLLHRQNNSCSSFTGRRIPGTLLHEALLYEEKFLQLSYRNKITCSSPIRRIIPAALPKEEE